MGVLRFKEGDRVLRCKQISDDQLKAINSGWYYYIPNGITGTIIKITRTNWGRIEHIFVKWDHNVRDKKQKIIAPEQISLGAAIYVLHPLDHCQTCKHKIRRLAESHCGTRSYKMSHKCFVRKWRRRLANRENND